MKANKLILMALAILLGVGTGAARAATNEVSALLQQGLFEEEANQNLDAAIQAYQSVIAQTDKNRQFAATAIFRLGECYRKQGKTNEAAAQYQRVVRDYADQPELAKLSRQYLTGFGVAASTASPADNADVILWNKVKNLPPSALEKVLPTLAPDPVLTSLLQQRNEAETKLAAVSNTEGERNPDRLAKQAVLDTINKQISDKIFGIMAALQMRAEISAPASSASVSSEARVLAGQISGIEQLKADPEEQARGVLAMFPDDGLKKMLEALPGLQEQEARLKANPKLTYNDLGGYRTAIAPTLDLAQQERHSTNLLTDAEHELSTQLSWIEDRVNFIMANQKARLKVLQLASGAAVAPVNFYAAMQTQRQVLDEEIKIVDQQVQSQQARVKLGVMSSDELSSTQMKLLELKRQRAALDTGQPFSPQATPEPNDEDKELARVQQMVQNSPDLINSPGGDELGRAANAGRLRVATFLLDHGADVNANSGGDIPLNSAAMSAQRSMVELLLNRGADVNARDSSGRTALLTATEGGFQAVVEVLLSHHADPNVHFTKMNAENTPLHLAARHGYTNLVSLLLANGADIAAINTQGETPLHTAAKTGNTAVMELLIAHQATVDARDNNGETPLLAAVQGGKLDAAALLLKNGADVNAKIIGSAYDGWMPLHFAVAANQNDLVKLLLDKNCEPNARIPVYFSTRTPGGGGRYGRNNSSSFGDVTPLLMAVLNGQNETADLLIAHKADVNAQNNDQQSALSLAVLNKSSELVKLLLQHRAKVDILDKDAWTPLQRAVSSLATDIAGSLLDAGANPNVKFPQEDGRNEWFTGHTMLGMAVGSDEKLLVQVLLSHKADPNLPDDTGNTPLSIAKQRSKETQQDPERARVVAEITELLLKAGANENLHRLSIISVNRDSDERTVFTREPNLPNHFSLLDFVTALYAPPFRNFPPHGMTIQELPGLAFPDLGRIKINRLQKDGRTNVIRVDLETALEAGDCSKDVPLEWGDIVEIPEADHNINEQWTGLSDQAIATLRKCLASQVVIMVKGQTNLVTLKPLRYRRNPVSNLGGGGGGGGEITYGRKMVGPNGFSGLDARDYPMEQPSQPSFWLYDVVHNANVILTSSDLSRVKVTRIDPATRKTIEMTIDLQKNDPANALWLRDGDVIELPEKP